jgi:hypothetical protein
MDSETGRAKRWWWGSLAATLLFGLTAVGLVIGTIWWALLIPTDGGD